MLKISIIFIVSCLLVSCVIPRDRHLLNVDYVRVDTKQLKIVADDGSFTLAEDVAPVKTPFHVSYDNVQPKTKSLLYNYRLALTNGAKKVKVYVAGEKNPLYGILAFYTTHSTSSGPGARIHAIKVSSSAVTSAQRGTVSVVWETVGSRMGREVSWSLWFSSTEL